MMQFPNRAPEPVNRRTTAEDVSTLEGVQNAYAKALNGFQDTVTGFTQAVKSLAEALSIQTEELSAIGAECHVIAEYCKKRGMNEQLFTPDELDDLEGDEESLSDED